MLLARLEKHPITGVNNRNRPATPLTEANTFSDVDRLSVRMGVPSRPRAWGKVDTAR
jgi:hypothetical protein